MIAIPSEQLSRLWRAIIEFDMLVPGDRVLVGLSGGKDSSLLLTALRQVQQHAPFSFDLGAFTMDPLFTDNFPTQRLQDFCTELGVPFYTEQVPVENLAANRPGKTPCFSCAYFRRAATNRVAKEQQYNKVALAHHHDDAVETFLLNLLTSGQLKTFLPVTPLSKSGLTVIRPLLYYREEEIRAMGKAAGIVPIKSPCPHDGHTKRQDAKEFIQTLETFDAEAYNHLGAAMRCRESELWPAAPGKEAMIQKFRRFWGKGNPDA